MYVYIYVQESQQFWDFVRNITYCSRKGLKLTFRKCPAIHTNYIIRHCTTLQYNHNVWRVRYFRQKSIISPYCHFGMHDHGLPAARLTCAAYVDGRKLENSSVWKDRIIGAFMFTNMWRHFHTRGALVGRRTTAAGFHRQNMCDVWAKTLEYRSKYTHNYFKSYCEGRHTLTALTNCHLTNCQICFVLCSQKSGRMNLVGSLFVQSCWYTGRLRW